MRFTRAPERHVRKGVDEWFVKAFGAGFRPTEPRTARTGATGVSPWGSTVRSPVALFAVFALVSAGAFVVWTRAQQEEAIRSVTPRVHYYGIPTWSLEAIDMKVVFFAPRDPEYDSASCAASRAAGEPSTPYRACQKPDVSAMRAYFEEKIVPAVVAFHEREFSGLSTFRLSAYPDLVVGRESSGAYEPKFLTLDALNPTYALEAELRERMFSPAGDLFWQEFSQTPEGHHQILLVVYAASVPLLDEGRAVPALIGDIGSTALIFAPVLDPVFRDQFPNAAAIIYHEMLHAMGVPEQYDITSPNVWTEINAREDIMGRGTGGPLLESFIGDDIKARLGIRSSDYGIIEESL